ncbi:response regulator transcription factor [Virgibacillus necropolis]|uniref:DNA-binding response regulator n=1 Tax=Virgibacillus necropolis TaxID=163877 RepID=A0A221MEX0_9BACI|nr:response regulator [Virgibacillus necropolis]ASN06218.1 DNA-binding response regulator [Virgibacillus necropolis]
MNILLVDDEQLELEQLEYLLKPFFNFKSVYKAKDASRALDIVDKVAIQLAFVDIQLPGKSGLELAKQFKNDYQIKVIMVTAFQSFEYAHQALRMGVEDYITKPLIESELIEVIQPYLQQANLSDMVNQTLETIHNRFDERLTLGEIADDIHVNNAYLSRKFNEELNTNFASYLNNYRIEMAKRMLKESPRMNISQVSETCGFNSQHYFSSLFKKQTGLTPREFRLKDVQI